MINKIIKKIEVVALFCGVGGLTCGLKKSGLDVIAGF
jgi:site-specific DNA-cytosine methylase